MLQFYGKALFKMERKRLKESLYMRASESTFHGISHSLKSDHIVLKIVWFVFFIASSCVCSYMIFKSIKQYLDYEVNTRYEIIYKIPSVFPAVTVCNINYFVTNYSFNFYQQYLKETNDENGFYDSYLRLKNKTATDKDFFKLLNSKLLTIVKAFNRNYLSERTKLGHSFDMMIVGCTFDGQPCSSDDFEWFFDFNYGNCFKFNTGIRTPLKHTVIPGWRNGLRLDIFVGFEYDPSTDIIPEMKTNAAQLMINDNMVMPNTFEGIQAAAGTETFIKLEKTIINKLPWPYSDCQIESQDEDRVNKRTRNSLFYEFSLEKNFTYKHIICIEICKVEEISRRCGCQIFDAAYSSNPNLRMCDSFQDTKCYFFHSVNMSNEIVKKCASACPLECNRVMYRTSVNAIEYPSESMFNYLKWSHSIEKLKQANYLNTIENYRKNFVRVYVFYEDLHHTEVTDSVSVELFDLASNVGGHFGLFLGVSFLSFVEVIELLLEISIYYLLEKYYEKKRIVTRTNIIRI